MRIAIIGGGIAGVSAAAALSPHGEVVLLEAEDALGYHASGRSAASFVEDYGNEVVRTLNRATRPGLEERGVLGPRGLMLIALAEEDTLFAESVEDMGIYEISVDEARAKVPIISGDIRRAAFTHEVMDIDTDLLMQGCVKEARAHGAEVRKNAKVSALTRGSCWKISVGSDEIEADIVVNAAGAWADEIARMAGIAPIGLVPYRRSVARMPVPGGHDARAWPMIFGPGESWYAKADAGGWIVSPAEEDRMEPMDAWADDMVLAEGMARYEPYVSEPVTRVDANWAGLRTFATDRTLVIGEATDASGFFWLAGQGGYGFQTSLGAAQVLAHHVVGSDAGIEPEMVAALHPKRFE